MTASLLSANALAAKRSPGSTGLIACWREQKFQERLSGWLGPAASCLILAAVWIGVGKIGIGRPATLIPHAAIFWMLFAVYYLIGVISDWIIFRRIWPLPLSGLPALLRKHVANELVVGYAGEAQFYLWARRHVRMAGSPFGAVKDVAVLSALAGNISTLAMMAASAPVLLLICDGPVARTFAASVGLVTVSSILMFLLRRSIFSLARGMLRFVFTVHLVRIAALLLLYVLLWHLMLPAVALGWWMTLGTLRMMISRLPLVPNKDVLFAGAVTLLLGRQGDLTAATALLASLVFATHLIVGGITAAAHVVGRAVGR